MFDLKEFHWVEWRRLVPQYVHNTAVPFPEILVPTVETVKMEWILKEMFLVGLCTSHIPSSTNLLLKSLLPLR